MKWYFVEDIEFILNSGSALMFEYQYTTYIKPSNKIG